MKLNKEILVALNEAKNSNEIITCKIKAFDYFDSIFSKDICNFIFEVLPKIKTIDIVDFIKKFGIYDNDANKKIKNHINGLESIILKYTGGNGFHTSAHITFTGTVEACAYFMHAMYSNLDEISYDDLVDTFKDNTNITNAKKMAEIINLDNEHARLK